MLREPPTRDEARVRGLTSHAVECALLLRQQRDLRASRCDGEAGGPGLVLPLAADRLHCKEASAVSQAGLRSTDVGRQEDVAAIAEPQMWT